jgi:glycosyltransferase involved in cell wall biosynthesis
VIVLVPSYQPTSRLLDVLDGLRETVPDAGVVVVDDGSGSSSDDLFRQAAARGADVIRYSVNRGKGSALKTGFRHIGRTWPGEDVVTADGDGQHTPADIARVAARLAESGHIVLGGRRFTGAVPLRSRLGNTVARATFRAATGRAVGDTQTGLRGFPATVLGWLTSVPGDRFDYELDVLLKAGPAGHVLDEVEIETVYLEQNASSHFRPVLDTLRVARPLLAYAGASLASFAIDVVALELLFSLTGMLLLAVVGARVTSATVNFALNRHLVFRSAERGRLRTDLLRYAALAAAVLGSNYVWMLALTGAGLPLLLAKAITEVTLYVIGFQVQRRFVFGRRRAEPVPTQDPAEPAREPVLAPLA